MEAAATVALGSQCDAQGHPRKGRLQGRGLRNAKIPPPIPSTMPIPCPACLPPKSPTVFIATRHAASLRPPRNGRIGFKPAYSQKGDPAPTDGIVCEVVVGACHRHHMRPTGINGHGVKAKKRRGTPRRYVLREMGE